jgi:hypothetical protein
LFVDILWLMIVVSNLTLEDLSLRCNNQYGYRGENRRQHYCPSGTFKIGKTIYNKRFVKYCNKNTTFGWCF